MSRSQSTPRHSPLPNSSIPSYPEHRQLNFGMLDFLDLLERLRTVEPVRGTADRTAGFGLSGARTAARKRRETDQ